MAALIGHAYRAVNPFGQIQRFRPTNILARHRSHTTEKKDVVNRLKSSGDSIAAKGFLRSLKPYEPPKNVAYRIERICREQSIPTEDDTKLEDPVLRFKIFTACEKELEHSVPNSQLCYIETIGDLKEFYFTPVDTTTPLDTLKRIELPPNLHVTYEYHRFHPDTDTMFDGKTAFPESSTIVTGLKYKKKYPGHKQATPYKDI